MTGLEWFLVLLLVVVGGIYLLNHRSPAEVPSSSTYPDSNDNPRGQTNVTNQHAHDDPKAQQSRDHGGCC